MTPPIISEELIQDPSIRSKKLPKTFLMKTNGNEKGLVCVGYVLYSLPSRHIFTGPTYFQDDIFPRRHITGMTYFRDHMILGGFSAHGFLPMVFYFWLRN
jgi:hypothetical protein